MITKTRIAGIPLRPLLHNERVPRVSLLSLAALTQSHAETDTRSYRATSHAGRMRTGFTKSRLMESRESKNEANSILNHDESRN